jgi:hypothetical protein
MGCYDRCDVEPTLPLETTTGENTLGYLVNGQLVSITNSLNMTAFYQGGGVYFGGGGAYMIVLDPFTVNVPYNFLDGSGISKAKYTKEVEELIFCFYEYSDTFNGFVEFSKIDEVNYIISGVFEFSTVTNGCDTIRITDGRFDLQYIP